MDMQRGLRLGDFIARFKVINKFMLASQKKRSLFLDRKKPFCQTTISNLWNILLQEDQSSSHISLDWFIFSLSNTIITLSEAKCNSELVFSRQWHTKEVRNRPSVAHDLLAFPFLTHPLPSTTHRVKGLTHNPPGSTLNPCPASLM